MADQQALASPPTRTYVHAIPSLRAVNPGLPSILGNHDLERSIQAGAPLDPQNLSDAKSVAEKLRVISDVALDDRVTDAVAVSAELRASAVETAHASLIYGPVTVDTVVQASDTGLDSAQINNQLTSINKQLTAIKNRLDFIEAFERNTRIISRNRNTISTMYQPLYKTVHGSGLYLAITALGDAYSILVDPTQASSMVGTTPPNFNCNYATYQMSDIIDLIVFYNEDFGVISTDSIAECVDKFHRFLTT